MQLPTKVKITSHRPIIGKLIVAYKRFIKLLIVPYLKTVFEKEHQMAEERFNSVDERFEKEHQMAEERFNSVDERFEKEHQMAEERFNITTKDILKRTDTLFVTLDQKLEKLEENMNTALNQVSRRFESLEDYFKLIGERIEPHARRLPYFDYLGFNERFGCDPEYVKSLHQQFLPFFTAKRNVLDIGAGRGLFLGLLKEKGIDAYGIEIVEDFMLLCKEKGLNVQKVDAISHLKSLEDNSLGGIFLSHIIEHLISREITTLVRLCYEKLEEGSYLIIITPNLSNLGILSHTFYKDIAHNRPLHPEILRFLLESNQFKEIEERFFSPLPDMMKLQLVEQIDRNAKEIDKLIKTINDNFLILNKFLYGDLDYAIIGMK